MSNFEKIYIDGKPTEKLHSIEKDGDQEVTYKVTEILFGCPPPISMKLDMPILEKQIKELGMHPDETSKSEIPKKKPAKNNKKSHKAAVEKV